MRYFYLIFSFIFIINFGFGQAVQNGDTVQVQIPVTNNGAGSDPNVVISVDYPLGLSFASADPSKGTYYSVLKEWRVGRLLAGQTETLDLYLIVNSIDSLPAIVTASVLGAASDPDTLNNVFADTIVHISDVISAVAVNFDYGCSCGSVAYNDTLCNFCSTKFALVPGSAVNGTVTYFDTLTGDYHFEVQDPNLAGEFQYDIICYDCGNNTDYAEGTATQVIPRMFVKPIGSGGGSESEMFYQGLDRDTIYHVASLDTTAIPLDNGQLDVTSAVIVGGGGTTTTRYTLTQKDGTTNIIDVTQNTSDNGVSNFTSINDSTLRIESSDGFFTTNNDLIIPQYDNLLNNKVTGVGVTEIDTTTKRIVINLASGDSLTALFTDYRGAAGTGDDWGAQVVQSDSTLKNNGTVASPLGLDFSKIKLSQFVDDYADDNGIYSGNGTLSGNTTVTTSGNWTRFENGNNFAQLSASGVRVENDPSPFAGGGYTIYSRDNIAHTDNDNVNSFRITSSTGIEIGDNASEYTRMTTADLDAGLTYEGFANYNGLLSNSLIPKQMLDDSVSAVLDSINALVIDNNTIYTTDDTLTGNRIVEQNGNVLTLNGGSLISTGDVGTTNVSGAGRRMMWLPSKYAFLAGRVESNIWDADSIGIGAVAFGLENKVSNSYVFSSGSYNEVSGSNSIALGNNMFSRSLGEVAVGTFGFDYVAGSDSIYNESDRIFSIGNGINGDRSNALVVYKGNQGDARFHFNPYQNNTIPDVTVEIEGELRVDSLLRVATKLIGADSSNVVTEMNISPNLSITGGVLDINTDSVLTKTEGEGTFVALNDTTYVKDTELDSFYTKGETDANFSTKSYADQAEQDAKDYADANDSDNQTLSIDSTGRVFTIDILDGNSVSFKDENTQLTDEEVEDLVGAMFSSNTEILTSVTYNDVSGKLNVVTNDDLSLYDNATSGFLVESDVSANRDSVANNKDSIEIFSTEIANLQDSITDLNSRLNTLEGVSESMALGGTIIDCGTAIGDSTANKQKGFVVPQSGNLTSFSYAFCDAPVGIGNENIDSVRVNLVLYSQANAYYSDDVGPETSGVSIVAYGTGTAQYKKQLTLAAPQAVTAGDIIKFEVTKADGTPLDAAVTIEGLYATAILEITSDQSNTAAATQP